MGGNQHSIVIPALHPGLFPRNAPDLVQVPETGLEELGETLPGIFFQAHDVYMKLVLAAEFRQGGCL